MSKRTAMDLAAERLLEVAKEYGMACGIQDDAAAAQVLRWTYARAIADMVNRAGLANDPQRKALAIATIRRDLEKDVEVEIALRQMRGGLYRGD